MHVTENNTSGTEDSASEVDREEAAFGLTGTTLQATPI